MGKRARRGVLLVAAGALALLAAACTPSPPTPNADYQFYAFDGSERPLSCPATPGPPLELIGTTYVFDPRVVESVDGVSEHVELFPRGGGFLLSPTTDEFANNSYSIVMLFRLSEIGGYDRLIDFKNGTSDNGLYLQDGTLRFFGVGARGSKVIANNEYAQVVVTRGQDGVVRGFVDGVQQWQFTDASEHGVFSANKAIFFRDNISGGATTEHSAGAVARIRVFGRPLSQTEINNLGQTPSSTCS